MNTYAGRVAAITGAASGIGRALAVELAGRGAQVALADIDADRLAETVALCSALGATVTSEIVDVADRQAVERWADHVVRDHGSVNFIFNNAGVALGAPIDSMTYDDFEWLMGIDFWGVVHGTKAFLPHLKASGQGHIINMSSVFGLLSFPTQSAYNAAKFAVRGFTDSLRMELEIEVSGVSALTVVPGTVRTSLNQSARIDQEWASRVGGADEVRNRFQKRSLTSPERAARVILTAVDKDRRRVVIGLDAKVFDLISRLPAQMYHPFLIAGARRRVT